MKIILLIGVIISSQFYTTLDRERPPTKYKSASYKKIKEFVLSDRIKFGINKPQIMNIINEILPSFINLSLSEYEFPKDLESFLDIKLHNLTKEEKIAVLSFRLFRNVLLFLESKNSKEKDIKLDVYFKEALGQVCQEYKESRDDQYNDRIQNVDKGNFEYVYLSYSKIIPSFISKKPVDKLYVVDYIRYLKTIRNETYMSFNKGEITSVVKNNAIFEDSYIIFLDLKDTFMINLSCSTDLKNLQGLQFGVKRVSLEVAIRLFGILSRLYKRYIGLKIGYTEDGHVFIKVESISERSKFEQVEKLREVKSKYSSQVDLRKKPSFLKAFRFKKSSSDKSFGSTLNLSDTKQMIGDCSEKDIMSALTMLTTLVISQQKIQKEFRNLIPKISKSKISESISKIISEDEDQDIRAYCSAGLCKRFAGEFHMSKEMKNLSELISKECTKEIRPFENFITDSHYQLLRALRVFNKSNLVEYIIAGNDGEELWPQIKFRNFLDRVGVGKLLINFLEWFHLPILHKDAGNLSNNLRVSTDKMKSEIAEYKKKYIENPTIFYLPDLHDKPNEFSPLCHYARVLAQNLNKFEVEKMYDMLGDCLIYLHSKKVLRNQNFSSLFYDIFEYLESLFELLKIKNQQNFFWLDKWCLGTMNIYTSHTSTQSDVLRINNEGSPDSSYCCTIEFGRENLTTCVTEEGFTKFITLCGSRQITIIDSNKDGCSAVFLDEWMRFIEEKGEPPSTWI